MARTITKKNSSSTRNEKKGVSFTLRQLRPGDEHSLQKHANNKKIWMNLTDEFPHPYTLSDARKWIKIGGKRKGCFAIVVENNAVGCIEYTPQHSHNNKLGRMGYWIGEPYWGKGIISEAIRRVVDHAFKNGIERLEARVYIWNPASKRALEKNGFTCEAIMMKGGCKEGKLVDEYSYFKLKQ